MIELRIITETKGYKNTDEWLNRCTQNFQFSTLKESKEFLKDRYGKSSRQPMYRTVAGHDKKVGYVYKFKTQEDYRDGTTYKCIQHDWVDFRESHLITP